MIIGFIQLRISVFWSHGYFFFFKDQYSSMCCCILIWYPCRKPLKMHLQLLSLEFVLCCHENLVTKSVCGFQAWLIQCTVNRNRKPPPSSSFPFKYSHCFQDFPSFHCALFQISHNLNIYFVQCSLDFGKRCWNLSMLLASEQHSTGVSLRGSCDLRCTPRTSGGTSKTAFQHPTFIAPVLI